MPNPTREDIIAAHDSLKEITGYLDHSFSGHTWDLISHLLENVQEALPPLPQPTMAEVEWDDDKHYLAEAEHPTFGKVIMLERSACPGFIRFARAKENEPTWQAAEEKTLTPTGKRYTLTEVHND